VNGEELFPNSSAKDEGDSCFTKEKKGQCGGEAPSVQLWVGAVLTEKKANP